MYTENMVGSHGERNRLGVPLFLLRASSSYVFSNIVCDNQVLQRLWYDSLAILFGCLADLLRILSLSGTGACLQTSNATETYPPYAEVTQNINTAPAGWTKPSPPSWGVSPYPVYAKISVYPPISS